MLVEGLDDSGDASNDSVVTYAELRAMKKKNEQEKKEKGEKSKKGKTGKKKGKGKKGVKGNKSRTIGKKGKKGKEVSPEVQGTDDAPEKADACEAKAKKKDLIGKGSKKKATKASTDCSLEEIPDKASAALNADSGDSQPSSLNQAETTVQPANNDNKTSAKKFVPWWKDSSKKSSVHDGRSNEQDADDGAGGVEEKSAAEPEEEDLETNDASSKGSDTKGKRKQNQVTETLSSKKTKDTTLPKDDQNVTHESPQQQVTKKASTKTSSRKESSSSSTCNQNSEVVPVQIKKHRNQRSDDDTPREAYEATLASDRDECKKAEFDKFVRCSISAYYTTFKTGLKFKKEKATKTQFIELAKGLMSEQIKTCTAIDLFLGS